MKKHNIIYTTFLLTAISCSNFKPFVFTNAFINPKTTTTVTYEDINFSYALFNQYASSLSYTLRMNYTLNTNDNRNNGVATFTCGFFNLWDTITATYAEAKLNSFWTNCFNLVLFDRNFDATTKKPITTGNRIQLAKFGGIFNEVVNYEIIIKSKIAYKINIGSVYLAYKSLASANVDTVNMFISFYNQDDTLLQTVLLNQNRANTNNSELYNLSTVITNVYRFDIKFQWVDTPPFAAGTSTILIDELNIFTQNQEISIPDDAGGNIFGFEFVAVEWWDILGHLQNFAWWIVNRSPISPLFEWIDTYVITWISGLITFITGVFNL